MSNGEELSVDGSDIKEIVIEFGDTSILVTWKDGTCRKAKSISV